MRLILLGCPGAGKGTQARYIANQYHIPHISTGDILRHAISEQTSLGRNVKAIVDSGHLVSDDVMTHLIRERLKRNDCQSGFLLDGYPRTLAQAKALETLSAIDAIIDIQLPEKEVIRRLSGRRIHPQSGRTYHLIDHPPKKQNQDDLTGEPLIQRQDDEEKTVRKRLSVYRIQTSPLQRYYQEHLPDRYLCIAGEGSVEAVKNKILTALSHLQGISS